jgi:hypothetical protein
LRFASKTFSAYWYSSITTDPVSLHQFESP